MEGFVTDCTAQSWGDFFCLVLDVHLDWLVDQQTNFVCCIVR
jgi:hypothetical protein